MAKSFPMQILLDRANEDLDAATKQLGVAQRERTDAVNQLDALLHYRDEYHARFAQTAQSGMPAGDWRNFQAFIDTLDAYSTKITGYSAAKVGQPLSDLDFEHFSFV